METPGHGSDILVDLNINEMHALREKYKEIENAHHVHTLIDLAIKWREQFGNERITITSPKGSWKIDGSIVVFVEAEATGIVPYSFDQTYKNVREGLLQTKRIPSNSFYFSIIHESYVNIIEEITEELDRKIRRKLESYFYMMSIETAKALEINCPPETYVKKLDKTHVERINDLWPHKCTNSEKALAVFIEQNGGYGLFSKDDDELMAWVMQGPFGHINALQTEEKHKGKGYAKIILQIMAKRMAEMGYIPLATVMVDNTPSVNLFNKLGFEIKGKSYFLEMENL